MSSGQVTPAGRERARGSVWECRVLSVEKRSLRRPSCPRPCAVVQGRNLAWAEPYLGGASRGWSLGAEVSASEEPCEEGGLQPQRERSRRNFHKLDLHGSHLFYHPHPFGQRGGRDTSPPGLRLPGLSPPAQLQEKPLALLCQHERLEGAPDALSAWVLVLVGAELLDLEGELRGQPSWGSRVSSSFPGSLGGPRWASHGRKPHRKQVQLRPAGGTRAAGRGACGSEPLIGGGPPGQLPPKRAAPNPVYRHTERGPPRPPCPDTQEHTYLCPCSGHMTCPCPHSTLPSPRLLSPFLSDGSQDQLWASPKLLLTGTEPAAADIAAFFHGVRTSPGPRDGSSLRLWWCLRGFLPPHWGGHGAAEPGAAAPPTRLPRVLALPAPPSCCLWPQRLFLALLVASLGSLSMWPQVEGDGEVNSASPWTVAGNVQPPLTHCR